MKRKVDSPASKLAQNPRRNMTTGFTNRTLLNIHSRISVPRSTPKEDRRLVTQRA